MTTASPSSLDPLPSESSLSAAAWERRYREGTTRWDLGQPAPALQALLESQAAPRPGTALVLGAGRGHDALLFARHGFAVSAVDFAPSAIQALGQRAVSEGLNLQLLQRDIFELVPEWAGRFDYVVEHTCFCAIDPARRSAYAALVSDLLVPGGSLLAVFFTHRRSGGPPFGTTAAEVRRLFQAQFEVQHLEPVANSVPSRRGEEHWGWLQKR